VPPEEEKIGVRKYRQRVACSFINYRNGFIAHANDTRRQNHPQIV